MPKKLLIALAILTVPFFGWSEASILPLPPICGNFLSSRATAKLDQRVLKFLTVQEKEKTKMGSVVKSPGEYVTVQGLRFPIVAYLGGGHESDVYLVETNKGFASAKVFFDEKFQRGIEEIKSYDQNLPAVFYTDPSSSTVLMEYREGVAMNKIWNEELGLSLDELREIERQFTTWKSEILTTNQPLPPFDKKNIVYSFKDKTFYFIDPA